MKDLNIKKYLATFSVFFFSLSFTLAFSLFVIKSLAPSGVKASTLTNASATLSNPRFSYRAGVDTGIINTSSVIIDGSGNPDNNTNHLFPSDVVCFTNAGPTGCIGSTTYTVQNIANGTTFNLTSTLGSSLDSGGFVIASQSGKLTITFTSVSAIPNGGSILITIPMANNQNGNDGIPDFGGESTDNGFDLNAMVAGDVSVTAGCTPANWGSATITPGSGTTDHTISIPRNTSSCAGASTITIEINDIVNPTPKTTSHIQGVADNYKVQVATRDGSNNTLDSASVGVAPVEGVLVSATVDQTLAFTVEGVSADSGTYCGVTRTALTTDSNATSIPWGTIATVNTFLDAQQVLTVSTNAGGGYSVKIEENDQMGMNGVTCTGATAGEANNCIKDTTCDSGSCTESVSGAWTIATNNGFGYTLDNAAGGGTDAAFVHGGNFTAKQLPDQEVPETKQTIMSNANPVSASQIYACYRISVSGTQPAGYYYNKVKYTATATF